MRRASQKIQSRMYSYLKRRKQGIIIKDVANLFQVLLSGVRQGSTATEAKTANFGDKNWQKIISKLTTK